MRHAKIQQLLKPLWKPRKIPPRRFVVCEDRDNCYLWIADYLTFDDALVFATSLKKPVSIVDILDKNEVLSVVYNG